MLPAITFILILFTILAWKRLDLALLILLASLPSYLIRFKFFGLPLTLLEVFILSAAAVWFVKYFLPTNQDLFKSGFLKRGGQKNYPYWREAILLITLSFIAAGVSGFSAGALGIWKAYFFEPILLFLIILNVFKDKDAYQKIFISLAVSVATVSWLAIYQQITGDLISNPFWADASTRRVVSFFGYPNAVGLFLAPLSIMFLGWLLSWEKTKILRVKKLLLTTVILSAWLAIYFSKSDGAMAAVFCGTGLMMLFYSHKTRVVTLSTLLLLLVSVPLFGLHQGAWGDKLRFRDLSGEIRRQQWQETVTMLRDKRLIMGAGLNGYQAAIRPYHQDGIFFNFDKLENFDAVVWANPDLQKKYWQPVEIYLYPHNILLNFWSEIGLLGALVFLWLISRAIFISYRAALLPGVNGRRLKFLPLGIVGALTAIIIHGLVDVPYFKNDLALMFWVIIALSALFELNNQAQPDKLLANK